MPHCFVIQPFDKSTFDMRYKDIFEPAIREAGLEPYRVDLDPSATIPIEKIEEKIRNADICFAEITTNNLNVWYELGYAFACGKDVVMVRCDDDGNSKFPFDIQHKTILVYKARSSSDFVDLKQNITTKLVAYLSNIKNAENISDSPIVETEGLNTHEIAALLIIFNNQPTEEDSLAIHRLIDYMDKAGFTDSATNLATRTLKRKGMIEINIISDEMGYPYPICRLTPKGEDWIINNQEKIQLKKKDKFIDEY